MGLEITAVGNHEFDEGRDELLRMQNGGCHPEDGCKGRTHVRGREVPYLAASTVDTKHRQDAAAGLRDQASSRASRWPSSASR